MQTHFKSRFSKFAALGALAAAILLTHHFSTTLPANAVDPLPNASASPDSSSSPAPTVAPSPSPSPSYVCGTYTPPAPKIVSVTTNAGKYTINWEPISDVPLGCSISNYRIFATGQALVVVPSGTLSYSGNTAKNGTVSVSALASNGMTGITSNVSRFDVISASFTNLQPTSVSISWTNLTSAVAEPSYSLRVSNDNGQSWKIPAGAASVVGKKDFEITELIAGLNYRVEISAPGTTTSIVTFATPSGITAPRISSLTWLSDRSARLNWAKTGFAAGGSTSKTSIFRNSSLIGNAIDGEPNGYVFDDLAEGMTYTFRIDVITSSGLKLSSNVFTYKHPAGLLAPLPPKYKSSPIRITSNSISFYWYAPTPSATRKAAVSYRVQYREYDDSVWQGPLTVRGNHILLTGLQPETRYAIQVRAIAADGTDSSTALTLSRTTLVNQNRPTNLVFIDQGDTWATLSWNYIIRPSSSTLHHFRVEMSKDEGLTWSTLLDNQPSTTRNVTFEDLEPETSYDFKIIAVLASGEEGDSEIGLITRKNIEAITGARVSVRSSTTALVKWASLAPETLSNTASLKIQISKDGKKWQTVSSSLPSNKTEFKLSNLKSRTTYQLRVQTLGRDGYSETSQSYKFKTR